MTSPSADGSAPDRGSDRASDAELADPPADRAARARAEFVHKGTYLNTASVGLPPARAWSALQAALEVWRDGGADPAGYDAPLEAARAGYASLVGVHRDLVAVGSQVSVLAGLVASSLPDGAEVLTAEGDFTSVLFPFHAQGRRGVDVREAPLDRLAEAVSPRTQLVAVSAVQSSDGRVADLTALRTACADTGTRILLDTTQAVGWLPVDASQYAYTVLGGYKWLMAPRGTAYLTVQPELLDGLVPNNAGWYAGADRWGSLYGSPLRLAESARRFDVSPVWHSWVAAAPTLELLTSIGTAGLHAHSVGMANRFRAGVGLPAGDSAIVSAAADPEAAALMQQADVVGSVRAGRLRLAFHLCTGEEDVDRASDVLSGHLRP